MIPSVSGGDSERGRRIEREITTLTRKNWSVIEKKMVTTRGIQIRVESSKKMIAILNADITVFKKRINQLQRQVKTEKEYVATLDKLEIKRM